MFDALDFVYLPSRDVAADPRYFTDVVGAELGFAIEASGTRVAMIRASPVPPALKLATPGPQRLALYELTRPEVAGAPVPSA